MRNAILSIENKGGSALLLWEPCRIERKETGRIVVGGSQNKALPLRGTNSAKGFSAQTVIVQLTGTNHGPWRLLVPVSRYGLFARAETLFGQPVGTLVAKFRPLNSLLRSSRTWVASEWFDEPAPSTFGNSGFIRPPAPGDNLLVQPGAGDFTRSSAIPSQNSAEESRVFMNLLRDFYGQSQRWPTNIAEAAAFATNRSQPAPTSRFDDATFTPSPDGKLAITYNNGRGRMTLSGTSARSGPSPFWSATPSRYPGSEPPFGFPRGGLGPTEDSQTFSFILRNFRARYNRWPANLTELKAFASGKDNFQPEFPVSFETGRYSNAVFTTKPDGGLQINYQSGSMSFGAPK
jgi:hypothetical protein